ncbi:MAG: hypothetical protein IPM10_09425 [Chitinophagaceae bacterium]|nr:hypothetical protein [Chitinophagaceae bacterium]
MKKMRYLQSVLQFLFTVLVSPVIAQNFASVDSAVKQFGGMSDKNVATIAQTITLAFPEKISKARAIYYWIAKNIALDPKASRSNDQKNSDPVKVIELRKATPLGFSLLFQEMCSQAGIRCLSVDGYSKNFAGEINDPADEMNHSWNVVQLGQSKDEWYYVDAAKAAGFLDKKQSIFTPQFCSAYFFADKNLFNLGNYPDNGAWQLGPGPKSLKDFYALPVIGSAAFELGIQKPAPAIGMLKSKLGGKINFTILQNGKKEITKLEILAGEERKKPKPMLVKFSSAEAGMQFTYTCKTEGEYPLIILADGREILAYKLVVEE